MLNKIISFLIILSILLFPDIRLGESFPSIQFIDFLLPLIAYVVYIGRKQLVWNRFYSFILVFCVYIVFTIFVNERLNFLSDYYELFKMLKFLLIILFFSIIEIDNFKKHVFYPTFVFLVVFNLCHYFNLFGVNKLIEDFYNGGMHLEFFGLNSLGGVSTKRMIGAIGNPNTNAIVFLFFGVIFYPKRNFFNFELVFFFTAMFLFFLCQSRTGFITLSVIILYDLIKRLVTSKWEISTSVPSLLVLFAFFFSFPFSSNLIETERYQSKVIVLKTPEVKVDATRTTYMNTLFSNDIVETGSVKGRIEIWEHLLEMIKKKPFFGHAPRKEYFYENELYPENEYILYLWRYGIVGLLFFLSFFIYLFYRGIVHSKLYNVDTLTFLTIVLLITSLANTPFSSREIFVFFGAFLGIFFNSNQLNYDEKY